MDKNTVSDQEAAYKVVIFVKFMILCQNVSTDIFPSSSFLDCYSAVLLLTRVNDTAGSMRRHLDRSEVAQAVQLHQDATSICTIARRFAASPSVVSRTWMGFQEIGSQTGPSEVLIPSAGQLSAPG